MCETECRLQPEIAPARTQTFDLAELTGRAVDLALALMLLPPAAIVGGVIYLLYRVFNRDGGPFFYSGERLGKDRRVFRIYKIRTLAVGSESKLKRELLKPGSGLEVRFGKFLRQTRLDELPQLLNVIKGDMSFIGPRPLRPSIYELSREEIPEYDTRFAVKPGLLGYSQVLTPHSTPKRMRAIIDNKYARARKTPLWEVGFIGYTILFLARNFLREIYLVCREFCVIVKNRAGFRDKRAMRRLRCRDVDILFADGEFRALEKTDLQLIDINYDALSVESDLNLGFQEIPLVLSFEDARRRRRKQINCKATVQRIRRANHGSAKQWVYVMRYAPVSPFHRFLVDQYLLRLSIC